MNERADGMGLELDERLDAVTERYAIESEVAAGPLERVYRGIDPEDDDAIVVRVYPIEGPTHLDDIQSTQIVDRDHLPERGAASGKEADNLPAGLWQDSSAQTVDGGALTGLSHPGIGEIREVWREDGIVAVAADAEEGESAVEILRRGEWVVDPDGAAELGHDIANALAYLHDEGVLHLEVHPANIVQPQSGRFRLTNSGVATLLQQELGPGALRAAPAYVAPERLRDGGEVGPWTDLYSLGVVLYEAITGSLPFAGPSVGDTLEAHIEFAPEPPHALNPNVDRFLSRLVSRLLEADPEGRYQSAEELRWDLRTYLGDREGDRRGITRRPRIWDPAPSDAPPFYIERPATEPLAGRLADGPDDETRVAVVRGTPGSGKTAVLERQSKRLRDRGLLPVPARASRHPAAVTVVEQLARGAVEALEQADEVDAEAWREHLQGVSPAARGLAARIENLAEWIQPGSETGEFVDNPRMRAIAGWRDLFTHLMTGPTSFVWIVDDIHEIDALSRELVTEFICRRTSPTSRWLVSRTPGRNDSGDEWMAGEIESSQRCVAGVDLSPLSRKAVEETLGYVIQATDEERSNLFDWLMDQSGGRPHHLRIAFHQLTDAGAIQFRAGKPRFIGSRFRDADLATTPEGYVQRNWQQLDLAEREMAAKIALFDEPLPYRLSRELVSHDVEDFHHHLTMLAERQLAETMTLGDQTWVWCSDDALREAIVATLDEEERARQHQMIAFELGDAHERIDETAFHDSWLAVQAACHWVGAGETARAAEWFVRAGRDRLDEGRVSNAVGLLRQAESRVDDPSALSERGRTLTELLGDALVAVGEDGQAADYYERALESTGLTGTGDDGRRVRLKLARTLKRRRRFEQAREVASLYFDEVGLEVPDSQELDWRFFGLLIKFTFLQWLEWIGGLETEWMADEDVERELDHIEAGRLHSATLVDDQFPLTPWFRYTLGLHALSKPDPRLLAVTYISQGISWCSGENPSAEYARRFRDAAVERLESIGDPRVRAHVGATAAVLSLRIGDREKALEYARDYRSVVLDAGSFSDYVRLLEVLIWLALQEGNLGAAEHYSRRLSADVHAFGGPEMRHVTQLFQARVEFLRGNHGQARSCVDAARAVNTRVQDPARAAQVDGIDLELLWEEESLEDAVELARATVDRIDGGLYGDELTETLCRAARLGVRASRCAADGELDARRETLLSFAERCCSLAEERTAAFTTHRALVRCEQGRLAEERGNLGAAGDHLDAAVRLADRSGLTRFQMLAYRLRSRVRGEEAPYSAIVDARRARMLAAGCGFTDDVERLDAQIGELLRVAPDLEPFLRRAKVTTESDDKRAVVPPELPSEDDEGGTIQLSPDETAVEIVSDVDTTSVAGREEPDTTRWPLPSSPEVSPAPMEPSSGLSAAADGGGEGSELDTSGESTVEGPPAAVSIGKEESTPPPLDRDDRAGEEDSADEEDADAAGVDADDDSAGEADTEPVDVDAPESDEGESDEAAEADAEEEPEDVVVSEDGDDEADSAGLRETADLPKDDLDLDGGSGSDDDDEGEDAGADEEGDGEDEVDANAQTPLPSPSDLSSGIPTDED